MLSSTSVGRPSAITRAASTRWRMQIGGIQYQDDCVRRCRAGHLAGQNVDGNFFVFRLRSETVNAGQIDQRNFFPISVADIAGVMFDGDAGKIADLLAQLGETIEQSGLAGIRRSYDGDGAI